MKFEYQQDIDGKVQKRLVFKWVGRKGGGHVRLFRASWERPQVQPGEGWLYRQMSLGLRPRIFTFDRRFRAWVLTLFGVRIHIRSVYGWRLAD